MVVDIGGAPNGGPRAPGRSARSRGAAAWPSPSRSSRWWTAGSACSASRPRAARPSRDASMGRPRGGARRAGAGPGRARKHPGGGVAGGRRRARRARRAVPARNRRPLRGQRGGAARRAARPQEPARRALHRARGAGDRDRRPVRTGARHQTALRDRRRQLDVGADGAGAAGAGLRAARLDHGRGRAVRHAAAAAARRHARAGRGARHDAVERPARPAYGGHRARGPEPRWRPRSSTR